MYTKQKQDRFTNATLSGSGLLDHHFPHPKRTLLLVINITPNMAYSWSLYQVTACSFHWLFDFFANLQYPKVAAILTCCLLWAGYGNNRKMLSDALLISNITIAAGADLFKWEINPNSSAVVFVEKVVDISDKLKKSRVCTLVCAQTCTTKWRNFVPRIQQRTV